MAKWQKGQSGNPKGRTKLPEDLKEVRKLNQVELERVLHDSLLLTPQQLKNIKADPESTMLQLIVTSILTQAANKGDPMRLNFLLDRLLGKMKETVSLTNPYMEKSYEELIQLLGEKIRKHGKQSDQENP